MRARFGLAALFALACGPSFQTIYENDARFEHCYAIDESGTESLPQKAECWHEWSQHHTLGQTRDRVEYAMSRYKALSQVPDLPTDESMMSAAPGEVGEHTQLSAPTPTNAFAPPPTTQAISDAGVTHPQPMPTVSIIPPLATEDAGPVARPPSANCTDECARDWETCKHGRNAPTCDASYSRCVISCINNRR